MKFYCGIDLGKRRVDLCILDQLGKRIARTSLNSDIHEILEWLQDYPKDLRIVFETCGTYYWLADGLEDGGYKDLTMAHTLHLRRITHAKIKTDKHDAFRLAELHRLDAIPEAYIYPRNLRSYRDLARQRLNLVRKRAGEFKEMKMMLTRHGFSGPSRNDIHHLDEDDMSEVMGKDIHLDYVIGKTIGVNDQYSAWIKSIEDDLESVFGDHPKIQEIRDIPGVGPVLSKTILLEVGDISRFRRSKDFCSWCRVIPSISQSGSSSRRGKGSKEGNVHMKNALMNAASCAARFDDRIRAFKEYHLSRRKGTAGTMIVLNMIAHKIAIGVWHILHDRGCDLERLFPIPPSEKEEKIGCNSDA